MYSNVYPAFHMLKHGVPQSSILGSRLFLCYLKGLPQLIGLPLHIFVQLENKGASKGVSSTI